MSGHRGLADQRLGTVLRRRWTLEKVLGVGGTATVYGATHRNGSRVAIKVLHPSLFADETIRRRFLREGYLANKIGVADVVKVLDDDVEGDLAYLVMELLEGASIEALRQRAGGRLAVADVTEVALRLLHVLESAHARGVLHRDIKPANLFRTVDPVGFKLLDFGIARAVSPTPGVDETGVGAGGFLGTPVFMAPEQARGTPEQLDERADLWSVGATLFTLLTGAFVHSGSSATEVLRALRDGESRAVGEQLRGVPAPLAAVVERALSFEPSARYPSAVEMRQACAEVRRSLVAAGERSAFFSPLARLSDSAPAEDPATDRSRATVDSAVRVSAPEPRAGFWLGRVSRLWWFYYTGPCTNETWSQYLEMVQRMVDGGLDTTLVCFAHLADAPSPLQRKQMADFIQKNAKGLERLDRFALVIDSVIHRGAITAISWLVKKPFEERVFNSPLAAIKWLTEPHPSLNPEEIRASIVAQVPRHSLWFALESEALETVTNSASA